jgi:hypothetical protein
MDDGGLTDEAPSGALPVVVIVDVANVMGSRPDGWWKNRAGAARKLVAGMPALVGRAVPAPDGAQVIVEQVVAVVEGAAKRIRAPAGMVVVRAPKDGDSTIVADARDYARIGAHVLVVTADQGLREGLPDGVIVAGPDWLNALLGR